MTTLVTTIVIVAAFVAVAYRVPTSVLTKPLGRVRAEVRVPSRRRSPQAIPPPAPRRDELPEVQELAWILRAQRWESTAETPELAQMSAHMNHGYYHGCKVCTGDTHAIVAAIHHALTARAAVDAEAQR